jgi:hypothetical protein
MQNFMPFRLSWMARAPTSHHIHLSRLICSGQDAADCTLNCVRIQVGSTIIKQAKWTSMRNAIGVAMLALPLTIWSRMTWQNSF